MIPTDKLELDLDKIKELGKQRKEKNYKFRTFLKGKDSEEIDKIVHEINNEVSSKIDCTLCGNCCMVLQAHFTKLDVARISEKINVTIDEFKNKIVKNDNGEYYIKDIPCYFLDGKKCSIYADRPTDCKSFPYLQKENFNSRLLGVIENYSICPIVFNIVERLKKQLNFDK